MIDAEQSPFNRYLSEVSPESQAEKLAEKLSKHLDETAQILATLPEEKAAYAYAEGKWTVRQLTGHILISQRIFVARAVCIARGEKKSFPGYDENAYAQDWPRENVALKDLCLAYADEARATRNWMRWMNAEELNREGVANEIRIKPEQLFRALIGHERHHLGILRERYGLHLSGNGNQQ